MRNKIGLNTLPWGTPASTGRGDERVPLKTTPTMRVEEVRKPGLNVALNAKGSELGKQNKMPECVECSR